MDNKQEHSLDEWDQKLEHKLIEIKKCQMTTQSKETCTGCPKFFDCELRKSYVIAVYESMNKGSGGGFEF